MIINFNEICGPNLGADRFRQGGNETLVKTMPDCFVFQVWVHSGKW
jgi:hypothetical protein